MTTTEKETFFQALRAGPAVLFLGQDVLARASTADHFLTAAATKLQSPGIQTYADLLNAAAGHKREDLCGSWHRLSCCIAVPDWLDVVAGVAWNTVLTSAFHEVVNRALETEWRQVVPVWNDRYQPDDPRSRRRLHLFKLFGCVSGGRPDEQPPSNFEELLERTGEAGVMLKGLASLVTPRGILVLESYAQNDWLPFTRLAEHLQRLAAGQIHWFGVQLGQAESPEIRHLREAGKLVLHEEPLAEWITWGWEQGLLETEDQSPEFNDGVALTIGKAGKRRDFKAIDWHRGTRGLPVLDDRATQEPEPLASDDDRYLEFQSFLYDTGRRGLPRWSDYARGFAFQRAGFDKLWHAVQGQLREPSLKPEPVLLSGQSGSGKTVALCDLAFRIRKEGWPVLFLGRSFTQLDFRQVGDACEWLEGIGATAVLVIWDVLQTPSEYAALASSLAQLGRKALVVGSAYRVNPEVAKRYQCFEFKAIMDGKERAAFLSHLGKFDPGIAVQQLPLLEKLGDNFFVALYHLLTSARSNLKRGLHGEHDRGLRELKQAQAQAPPAKIDPKDWFSERLHAAGGERWQALWRGTDASDGSTPESHSKDEPFAKLSRLVLVPGRYGEDVPIDLLLRCLPDGFALLRSDAFRDIGIFEWNEDPDGNPLIGVRSSKEAELLCQSDFVTLEQETETLHLLLTNVRPGDWERPNREINFALRLLRQIEPDGPHGHRFKERLDKLVGMLSDWRQQWNQLHPELVIREANLRRERLRQFTNDLHDTAQPAKRHVYLDEFRQGRVLIMRALEKISQASHGSKSHKRLTSYLRTELGSLYGTAQEFYMQLLRVHQDAGERDEWRVELADSYQEAMEQCKLAVATDPLNARPADVRFWVARNRYRNDEDLSQEQRAELLCDMYDALEENTWQAEPEKYHARLLDLGNVLNDEKITQEALKSLDAMGSMTGHYLLAVNRVYDRDHIFRERGSLIEALDHLDRTKGVLGDLRILRLYLRVWWQLHGNPELFEGERLGASLQRSQWQFLSKLLALRLGHPEEETNAYARFLYAWSLFQQEEIGLSKDEFRMLERLGMGGKYRVVHLATWCDSAGKPIPCTGTIRRMYAGDEGERGFVYCSQIRSQIPFQAKDFVGQQLRRDGPLGDFFIAFNFRGAIADPARYYRKGNDDRRGAP
jgi:hypothetical protein